MALFNYAILDIEMLKVKFCHGRGFQLVPKSENSDGMYGHQQSEEGHMFPTFEIGGDYPLHFSRTLIKLVSICLIPKLAL